MGLLDDPRLADYIALFPRLHAAREQAALEHIGPDWMNDPRLADYTALAAKLRVGSESIALKHLVETQDTGGGGSGGGGGTTTSPMRGMNLPLNTAYSTFSAFVNPIHKAREWTKPGGLQLATVDAQGVPTEAAETLIFQGSYPAGVYLFDNCNPSGPGVSIIGATSARTTAQLSGSGNVTASHSGFGGGTPSVARLDETSGSSFRAEAIDQLREARIDCLRVMMWQRTTYAGGDSARLGWDPVLSERLTPQYSRWSSAPGMPWEVLLELVRELGIKRLWINPPLLSPADYLTEMASVFGEWIDEGGELIVEDSNEVWNKQFPAHNLARGIPSSGVALADAVGYGIDAAATCKTLVSAFGSRPWKFAMMGTTTDSGWLSTAVSTAKTNGLSKLNMLGCSGYLPAPINEWKLLDEATQRAYPVESIVEDMRKGLPRLSASLAKHKALADQHGAEFAVYEAGPSALTGTAGGGALPIADQVIAAYRSPGWGGLWTEIADEIKSHDPSVCCWFAWMHPVSMTNGQFGYYENHSTLSPMGQAFLDYQG